MRSSRVLLAVALMGCAHAPPARQVSTLTSLDGSPIDFGAELAAYEATVVVFFSTSCPCVARYERRVEALAAAYASRGVRVVYVSSNADDDAPRLREAVAERALRPPLWVDWSGGLAERLGATSTPTVVVLDSRGDVQFRGWVDNERDVGESGREPWLERALESMVRGGVADPASSPTFGCRITRSLGAPRVCPAVHHADGAASQR